MWEIKRRRLPPLNALKAFEAAARLGSFTAAADELLVSSGAVRRHIANLESFLGLRLFWRSHSEIGLTPAGQVYGEQMLRAMTLIEHETRRMVQLANPRQLRIRAGPTFAHCWLAPRLAHFCAINPQTELLVTTNVGEIDSSEDHFDVSIHMLRSPRAGSGDQLLFESEITAVCHPRRLQEGSLFEPKDLAGLVLLHSLNRMTYWRQWFQAAGVKAGNFETGPKFNSSVLAYEAAKGDLGIACAEVEFVRAELEAGRLARPFDLRVPTHDGFYLSVDPNKADIGAIQAFREWILSETSHLRNRAPWSAARDEKISA